MVEIGGVNDIDWIGSLSRFLGVFEIVSGRSFIVGSQGVQGGVQTRLALTELRRRQGGVGEFKSGQERGEKAYEGFGALLDDLDRGGGHCNYLIELSKGERREG